jgi:hypothetical protein
VHVFQCKRSTSLRCQCIFVTGSESAVKRRGNKRSAGSGDAPGAVDEDFARLRRTLEAASASLPVLDAHGDEGEGGGGARQAGGAGAGAMEVVEDDPQVTCTTPRV